MVRRFTASIATIVEDPSYDVTAQVDPTGLTKHKCLFSSRKSATLTRKRSMVRVHSGLPFFSALNFLPEISYLGSLSGGRFCDSRSIRFSHSGGPVYSIAAVSDEAGRKAQ